MINKLIAIFFVAMSLFLCQTAEATDDFARFMQKQYGKINSFKAEFEQTLTHRESGSVQNRKGILLFQKPLSIRWQTQKPNPEILVATAKEIWEYLPDEEIAYRYHPDLIKSSGQIISVVTGQATLSKDFHMKMQTMENNLQKIRLFPKEPTTQLVEASIWVDPSTGYIRRVLAIDFYGNSNQIDFISFKPNPEISVSSFKFSPPAGTVVEDRSNDASGKEFFK